MGVDGCRLHGRDLRNAFGYFERLGRGDYLYGSGECAGACDCDADCQVGDGYEQDRGGDDHRHGCASGGCVCKSDERFGADRQDAKRHCHGIKRYAE